MTGRRVTGEFLIFPALHADALPLDYGMSFVLLAGGHASLLQMKTHGGIGNLQRVGDFQLRCSGIPHFSDIDAQLLGRGPLPATF